MVFSFPLGTQGKEEFFSSVVDKKMYKIAIKPPKDKEDLNKKGISMHVEVRIYVGGVVGPFSLSGPSNGHKINNGHASYQLDLSPSRVTHIHEYPYQKSACLYKRPLKAAA